MNVENPMAAASQELQRVTALAAEARPALAASDRAARASCLEALAGVLENHRSDLVALADLETHLGDARLNGELSRTVFQLRMCADEARSGRYLDAVIDTPIVEAPPVGRPDLRRMNRPLGPVAVFAASNFPFAFSVLGNDTASALAAGCPVILKPHEGHRKLSVKVFGIAEACLREAGAPLGTLSLFHSRGPADNLALVQSSTIRAVGFTGSTGGGRALLDAIGRRPDPIPFFGELGSVNPVLVLPGAATARGEALGKELAAGATLGMGQFCTNPGVVFVPKGDAGDALVQSFLDAVPGAPVHALLNDRISAGFEAALADQASGPVGQLSAPGGAHTVLAAQLNDFVGSETLQEEVFGPSTLFVWYDETRHLVDALSGFSGSLTASVHSDKSDAVMAAVLLSEVERFAGRILFEGVPPGVAIAPAMVHGGPWPAGSRPEATSVGPASIVRWTRPVCYQSAPQAILPVELRDETVGLPRMVNGAYSEGQIIDT